MSNRVDLLTDALAEIARLREERRGWLTEEEREAVNGCLRSVREEIDLLKRWRPDHRFVDDWRRKEAVLTALLARETPPRVKVPTWIHDDVRRCVIAAIRAAGGEVEG